MDLFAPKLRLFPLAGHYDCPARGVYFHCVLERDLGRQEKNIRKHLDDVVVGVFVVIEQYDMIEWREIFAMFCSRPYVRGA